MADITYSGGDTTKAGTNQDDDIFAVDILNPFGGILIAENGRDTVFGLGGDDTISSGENNDTLFGGSGNDELRGGDGNDVLFGGSGNDTLKGGDDNDIINVETRLTNFGTDTISGGDGFDTLRFNTATVTEHFLSNPTFTVQEAARGVSVNLINVFVPGTVGDYQLVTNTDGSVGALVTQTRGRIVDESGTSSVLADIERIELTDFDDFILDSIASHEINGGDGDDFISGGGGNDLINGGSDTDTVMYNFANSRVSVSLLDFGSGGNATDGDGGSDTLVSIENVHASRFNDFVLGNSDDNTILGFAGDDTILAGSGNDTIRGGDNNDFLRGGLGNDTVDGGAGTDTAEFNDWNGFTSNVFSSLRGSITLGEGNTATSAVLTRTTGGFLTSTIETDTLIGIENVNGSDHAETITGNSLANILNGDGGNDVIDGGRGADTLNGGNGIDTATFLSGNLFQFVSVEASLSSGLANISRTTLTLNGAVTTTETDTLSSIENLTSGSGTDRLTGNASGNILNGGAGGDTLAGLGGADTLIGGDGIDTADYKASTDSVKVHLGLGLASSGHAEGDSLQSIENLTGSEHGDSLSGSDDVNVIKGNGGDDIIEGGAGADTLDGGAGINTLSYESSAGVLVSLSGAFAATGDAAGDVTSNFQNISGSTTGDDFLIGDAGDNQLFGNGGNDVLIGGVGADLLNGGEGFDTANYNGPGAVNIDLAQGIAAGKAEGDTYVSIEAFLGGDGADTMKGDSGGNTFSGFGGQNTLVGRGGDDTLLGGADEDTLLGGNDNDTLNGGGKADVLEGGAGSDTMSGGGGLDTLEGGAGDDIMFGNGGSDTFIFNGLNAGNDEIRDFQDGVDVIQFNSNFVDRFADLDISGNGTDHVTINYGDNSIDLFGANPITLTAADFTIL